MPYNFESISILVVEDNKPILDLVKSLLASFGVKRIFTAAHGREGYKIYCQEKPDVVITDLMMTPMDGAELAKRIRTDANSPDPYVPIILITAFSEKSRILNARDQGVTEFLVKPFNARDLYRRIVQVIESPRKFVRAGSFFGPDRRRKRKQDYEGKLRRKTDVTDKDYDNWKANKYLVDTNRDQD